ncbi:SAM-dependent methyltransferase [Streptomyces sp. NBC_01381]|uniref:SAM-dependent methyltransferase n=1 Tax=Streptomyces sp. NBC_01381 TaxID=2903845 RepID=UPI0022519605|nr:SAM-dependent methyltransferase [Streptomyces sp. NBC_01381]MCX4669395.1 SAM-dependent methyltransferase [Streptomyces sp. NBC_01381]
MADSRINTTQPHTARIWNYWLGGKDNYPVDQAAGDQIRTLHPGIGEYARADRLFLGRAVSHLVTECGIRQFLDIGTGLPTADNTHEVAQRLAPETRVVYVDNDPLVLTHARALLTSTPEGKTDYLDEDLRNVEAILEHAAKTLDFDQPVALMLLGVVIFIDDDSEAYGIVRRLLDALPAGSHLVLSHTITSPSMPDVDEAVAFWNENGTPKLTQRTPDRVAEFFDGLELLDPGVVSCNRWRPESDAASGLEDVAMFGGVGVKR